MSGLRIPKCSDDRIGPRYARRSGALNPSCEQPHMPKRFLDKCNECRSRKQKCSPQPRLWPAKCEYCQEKGLECNAPTRVRPRRYKKRISTPAPKKKSSRSSLTETSSSNSSGTSIITTEPNKVITAAELVSPGLISRVPCRRDPNFIGRTSQLDRLSEIFCKTHIHHRAAITGSWGVGKTALAIEFAYQNCDKHFQTIICLSAESLSQFEQSCRYAVFKLKLESRNDTSRKACEILHSRLSEWEGGRCLVIIDDVNNTMLENLIDNDHGSSAHPPPVDLLKFPSTNCHVSVLVTTRFRKIARQLNDDLDEILCLGPMDQEEALELLGKKTHQHSNSSTTGQRQTLVALLENLPLAIAQATIYMVENNIPIQKYLEHLIHDEKTKMELLERKLRNLRRNHQPMTSILNIIWDTLDHLENTLPLAMNVLSQLSIFHHCDIPRMLLNLTDVTIGALVDHSILDKGAEADNYSLAQISQSAIRQWLRQGKRFVSAVEQVSAFLSTIFPLGDFTDWTTCKVLEPHAGRVLALNEGLESAGQSYEVLCYKLARYASSTGRLKLALKLIERIWRQRAQFASPADRAPDSLDIYRLMAVTYAKSGDHQKAEEIIRGQLSQRDRSSDPPYLISVKDRTSLAALQVCHVDVRQFNFDQVIELYRQVLDENQKVLGLEHPSTLATKSNLAVFEHYNKEWTKDKSIQEPRFQSQFETQQRVWLAQVRSLGSGHPSTLASLSSLAVLSFYHALHDGSNLQARRKRSEDILEDVLRWLDKLLGKSHPLTLLNMSNAAMLIFQKDQGEDRTKAERMQNDVVSLLRSTQITGNLLLQSIRNLDIMRQYMKFDKPDWLAYCLKPIPLVAMDQVDTILVSWAHMLSFSNQIEVNAQDMFRKGQINHTRRTVTQSIHSGKRGPGESNDGEGH